MNLEPYSFCFLRYIHEPLSGEFANVGVLLWAPKSQTLLFQGTEKFSRLSKFFADFHKEDYRNMMKRIQTRFTELSDELRESSLELVLGEKPESARDLAINVIPVDSAALQWSLSSGGLCESPEKEMRLLFEGQIENHYNVLDSFRRDEAKVYSEVYRQAFVREAVKKHLRKHKIEAPLASHEFENAWKNGKWNVYQTLSFDLIKPEDIRQKAYRWHAEAGFLSQSPEAHQLHFLLGEPQGGRNERAYSDARKILASFQKVTLVEEDEAEDFGNSLEKEILQSTR